jgi:hypothetical protein
MTNREIVALNLLALEQSKAVALLSVAFIGIPPVLNRC